MAAVEMSQALRSPAGKVWELIGGFDELPKWHPAIAASTATVEHGVKHRRLALQGGGEVLEALERLDDVGRSCAYAIIESPLPVAGYRAVLRVEETGPQSCTVHWYSRFEPHGAPEADAVAAIRGVYQAGFDALAKRFGG